MSVGGVHRLGAEVGGGVGHQGDVVAELHRIAARGLDAGVGDHADDDHPLDAELLELLVEVGVGEPARPPVFEHHHIVRLRLEVVVEGPAPAALGEGLPLGRRQLVRRRVQPAT